jgi:hypothetical protein
LSRRVNYTTLVIFICNNTSDENKKGVGSWLLLNKPSKNTMGKTLIMAEALKLG